MSYLLTDLNQIFNGENGNINWADFSPDALGMHLNFDEMSAEELQKIVAAFIKLKLITEEEAEAFGASLTDPRMRNMLQGVMDNWPETMNRIVKDPDYVNFLKDFQSNIDEAALATIVGFKDGLKGIPTGQE